MARLARRLFLILLLAGLAGVGVAAWGWGELVRPGPLQTETTVVIPRGAGVDGIARTLLRAGVITDLDIFILGTRVLRLGTRLRAGEFAFPPRISARGTMEVLAEGKTVVRRVTVAEGLTSARVMDLVASVEGLTDDPGPVPPEGALLPETYHFSHGDPRVDMVVRMRRAMAETLAELWADRAEGLPFDTPEEALVLASIVEKETGIAHERGHIAGVFVNRLRAGMRLQSDPTVAYGIGGGPLDRPLTRADLRAPTPYNTYVIDGLPPGPICNPGRATIEAVLHPTETDHLYFVADGTGGHVFAKTLDEHNQNVMKWREIRDGA